MLTSSAISYIPGWTRDMNEQLVWAHKPDSFDMIALDVSNEHVHSIRIHSASLLNSGALSVLGNLGEQLRSLEVGKIPSLHDFIWVYNVFSKCSNLKSLNLTSEHFDGFENYLGLSKYGKELKHIELNEVPLVCYDDSKKMTDASFKTLMLALPKLKTLHITCFGKLTSKGLSEITNLKKLSLLLLDDVPGVDDSVVFRVLKECPTIVGMRLRAAGITDHSIGPIFKSTITTLNLQFSDKISAEALCLLCPHPTLEAFIASNTKLDDRFLMNPPEKLRLLSINDCPVSEKAVEVFRKAHPKIDISGKPKSTNESTGWLSKVW